MDTRKLEALIKKNEKKRDAQKKKVKAAEAKAEAERKILEELEADLKPMYALRKKAAKFEKDFNASVANFEAEEAEEAKEEKPAASAPAYSSPWGNSYQS